MLNGLFNRGILFEKKLKNKKVNEKYSFAYLNTFGSLNDWKIKNKTKNFIFIVINTIVYIYKRVRLLLIYKTFSLFIYLIYESSVYEFVLN